MKKVNFEALFLGPQGENHGFFKELLSFMVDEHIHWRRNFHPYDKPSVTLWDQQLPDFKETIQEIQNKLLELSAKLKTSSMPWHSPRYLGHMTSDIMIPAVLGYITTMLYNPNNVAWEASPATTKLEIEVGQDFAKLMGYDPELSWGHITSGGHVANYEALWVARNLKSVPIALKNMGSKLIKTSDSWKLLNFSTTQVLDVLDKEIESIKRGTKNPKVQEKRELAFWKKLWGESARGKGLREFNMGKVIVPRTKHYSFNKVADVLGLGQNNFIFIKVKNNYTMDIDDLKNNINNLISNKVPILAVVAVVGTTEEGAVDEIDKIVELREHYQKKKAVSFYIHVDAAYGGYARTIFLDGSNKFSDHDSLKKRLNKNGIIDYDIKWPSDRVYRAYQVLSDVDSVTIDPHKMGYVPYQSGGVVFKDKRVRDVISHFAPYVFKQEEWRNAPNLLGSFILEGSKAGAAAASVWMAHQCVPLNVNGYGKLIGESVEGAFLLYNALLKRKTFEVSKGKKKIKVKVAPLTEPDLNIVVYAFNPEGNTSLKKMNKFNERMKKEHFSYPKDTIRPILEKDFIISDTELSAEEYGDVPKEFVLRLGIPESEWKKVGKVFVLRSCVMTPYLTLDYTKEDYVGKFINTLKEKLSVLVGGL
ncbi:MAG: pyridoxal phosphate-dependent decarboxylase family protein [Candidatus Ranarchaeia archaeon]